MRHLESIEADTPVSTPGTVYKWTTDDSAMHKAMPTKYKMQAIAPAALICCAIGMKWAWSVFEPPGRRFDGTAIEIVLVRCTLFFGMFLGSSLASFFLEKYEKNIVHCISGILVAVGAVLTIIAPQQPYILMCSCLLEGTAYAISLLLIYINGSELAPPQTRAFVLISGERTSFWLGVLLQLLFTRIYYAQAAEQANLWNVNRLHGLAILFLSIISLILTYWQKRCLVLRPRLFVRKSSSAESNINLFSLVHVLMLRLYASVSLSLSFTSIYMVLSWHAFNTNLNCIYTLAIAGLLGTLIGSRLIDVYGRKRIATCGALLCSQILLVLAGIFKELMSSEQLVADITIQIAIVLMLLYELFNSLGVGAVSTAYAAEAFCQKTKPAALSIVIGSEGLLHIVVIIFTMYLNISNCMYFFILGWISFFVGVCVFVFLPETKSCTLNECVQLFRSAAPTI